ncbi:MULTISPECIES: CarD family transcriptional regulator [Bacillaceae]|uniref:CarD family transcriptional regulator n=1 Tax=Bacillaceae TaxID=186817 RepID=UPI000C756ADA|nr:MULTISPECIES: CarD family transcriptional regulator [Bacillaceae]PLR67530.1 transcription factor YdeB [Bacillus sp. UMB0893]QNG59823.1 transcription factor YdeB [Bacillus sp. PAMC26568]
MEVDFLFKIGDKIMYPMHGAGVIESIKEMEIQGKKQDYFVIKLSIGDLQIMIPHQKLNKLGIRAVEDRLKLEEVLVVFHDGETDELLPWKERYKTNMEKIKSGEIQQGAEVVRDLMRKSNEKTLNTSEKQMLNNARNIFISELILIEGCTENQANEMLITSKIS